MATVAEEHAGTLDLERGQPPAQGIAAAFRRVHQHALSMEALATEEPARAVHEYRKSVRRLRALTRLVARLLDEGPSDHLGGCLRQVARSTSILRDHAVLLGTLQSLQPSPASALAHERAVAVLEQMQADIATPERTLEVLGEGCRLITPLADEFEAALRSRVRPKHLARAMRATARRVRRAARRARKSRLDADVHRWRKRTKELRYQLELFRKIGRGAVRRQQRYVAVLAEELGDVTDMMLLEAHLRQRFGDSDAEEFEPLLDEIRASVEDRRRTAFRMARPILELRPRTIARSVEKALKM